MNDIDMKRFLVAYGKMLEELYPEFANITSKIDTETKETIVEITINFQLIKINVTGDSITAMMYDISKALLEAGVETNVI